MQTLLGRYAVGDASCLADPGLAAIAQDYRRKAQARMQPLDPEQLHKKLPVAKYHVSLKLDGEFNILVYQDGEAILVNPGGTVRTGLPELERAAWHFQAAGVRRAVVAGELWWHRPDEGRERVHDVVRVARKPNSDSELLDLRFAAFDLIDLDGKEHCDSFELVLAILEGLYLDTPPHCLCSKLDDILWQFKLWTDAGHEGIVLRSDQAGSYKIKPRHSIDAVVIGFTQSPARPGMVHDLLVALMRPDGTFQVLGRVGGGFTDQDRRNWLCDLQDWIVESDYTEANDGVAYQMVWPKLVIEISVLDVIAQNTRGAPIQAMCLDLRSADRGDGVATGCWRMVRKLPLVALIAPQFVRRCDDKGVNATDLRLEQVTALVEVPLVDRDARQCSLPPSQVLRRAAWTKKLKGKTAVRKLILWQTNKNVPLLADGDADFPAYVIAYTDYSPDRQTPLERDIRVSNSRQQIDALWDELVQEKIVKGWIQAA
jgi:hypothetical protein